MCSKSRHFSSYIIIFKSAVEIINMCFKVLTLQMQDWETGHIFILKTTFFSSTPFILKLLHRDPLIFISCLPAISNIKLYEFPYIFYILHNTMISILNDVKIGFKCHKMSEMSVIGLFLVHPKNLFATGILGNATLCFNQIAVISLVLYIRFIGRILINKKITVFAFKQI